jgi:hypothetical protein
MKKFNKSSGCEPSPNASNSVITKAIITPERNSMIYFSNTLKQHNVVKNHLILS